MSTEIFQLIGAENTEKTMVICVREGTEHLRHVDNMRVGDVAQWEAFEQHV